jgi:hypothetical protein
VCAVTGLETQTSALVISAAAAVLPASDSRSYLRLA